MKKKGKGFIAKALVIFLIVAMVITYSIPFFSSMF